MARLLRAFAIQIAVVIALLLGGLAVHAYRTQPRPARALVELELREGSLAQGERVVTLVSVFRRRPSDYFRATRGGAGVDRRAPGVRRHRPPRHPRAGRAGAGVRVARLRPRYAPTALERAHPARR